MAKSLLLNTIIADLSAGESWFTDEAEKTGLFLWNTVKSAFIALEPKVAVILTEALKAAVAGALEGAGVPEIETALLNKATGDLLPAIEQAGSGVIQVLISGLLAQKKSSGAA